MIRKLQHGSNPVGVEIYSEGPVDIGIYSGGTELITARTAFNRKKKEKNQSAISTPN